MFENFDEQYITKVNTLMGSLPNNPYVIDIVGKAIQISYDYTHTEGNVNDFDMRLDLAIEAAKFATAISRPMYYLSHFVQAPLLIQVPEEQYATLDTASGTLKTLVTKLTAFINSTSFKERWLFIIDFLKDMPEAFAILLMIMINTIEVINNKEQKTLADHYIIMGMAFLECSIRTGGFSVLDKVRPYKDKLTNLMLTKVDF